MGCHRNHAITHSPNQNFFEDTYVSHPGGPNEQFGTHENCPGGVQGNLNWMPGYKMASNHFTPLLSIELKEQPCCLLFTSAPFIQVHFRPDFIREANTMNPDQTAPSWEQSDLGP